MLPNAVKLRIDIIHQLATDYVMIKMAIPALANTIKQLHIQKNMHMTYKQDFYTTKEKEIYYLFLEYLVTIVEDIEHPALIEEWIQNIDAASYEINLDQDVKLPSIKKKIDRNDKT